MSGFLGFYLVSLVLCATVCYRGCRYDVTVKGLDFTVTDLIVYSLLVFIPIINFLVIFVGVFLEPTAIFHPYKFKFLDKILIKGKKNG